MRLGNEWRDFQDFCVQHKGMNWEVHSSEGCTGYQVWAWHDDDEDPDDVVPKYYYSLRNGDRERPDVESFNPGFYEAVHSDDAVFYSL